MRAAPPQTEPDGRLAGRPPGRVSLLLVAVAALALFTGVGPAAAHTAEEPAASAPSVAIELLECDLLGASDIVVSVAGLSTGAYTATVTTDGAPVAGVPDAAVSATSNSHVFADLPNGGTYTVTVLDWRGAAVASAATSLPVCDLPTLDDPAEEGSSAEEPATADERTLAATGLPVSGTLLVGLGAFQAGALLAIAGLVRRRA